MSIGEDAIANDPKESRDGSKSGRLKKGPKGNLVARAT